MKPERLQMNLFTGGFRNLALDDRIRAVIAAGVPVAYSPLGGDDRIADLFHAELHKEAA